MTPSEVKIMVEELGIPSTYYQFADNTDLAPPFVCYFFTPSNDLSADNINYVRVEKLNIELYTDVKDFDLEKQLEQILAEHEIFFAKEETNIDSERMHETIYTSDIILEV
jgi:hypothetical protein